MTGQKFITAGFLAAALAGCQSDDNKDITAIFSCTDGQHGANVVLIDQDRKAELTLTEQYAVTLRPYLRGNRTIYRDVAEPSAVEDMKKTARAYCGTGVRPR